MAAMSRLTSRNGASAGGPPGDKQRRQPLPGAPHPPGAPRDRARRSRGRCRARRGSSPRAARRRTFAAPRRAGRPTAACTTAGTARPGRGCPRSAGRLVARQRQHDGHQLGQQHDRKHQRARSRNPAGTARRRDGTRVARWRTMCSRAGATQSSLPEHIRFEAEKRGDVFVRAVLGQARVVQQRHLHQRQLDAELGGHLAADLEVLGVQADLEAERELAADHGRAALRQEPVAGCPFLQRRDQPVHRQALGLAEGQRLRDRLVDAGDHDLVGGLGRLARADRAHQVMLPPMASSAGPGALQRGLVAADHDRQRAGAAPRCRR
jgi:hypothetical protein